MQQPTLLRRVLRRFWGNAFVQESETGAASRGAAVVPLSTTGTRYGNSVSTAWMPPNQRRNSASTDSPLQRIKEKNRYGISVSTPHRRYGHRLQTPFLRDPVSETPILRTALGRVLRLFDAFIDYTWLLGLVLDCVDSSAPKTQIFAENRRFSQTPPLFLEIPALEGAGNCRKTHIFAENRRFLQKTIGNRRLGSVTLGPSPLARP